MMKLYEDGTGPKFKPMKPERIMEELDQAGICDAADLVCLECLAGDASASGGD
jgi:hypothetical protein